MSQGRKVSPFRKGTKLEYKLASKMGLKRKDGLFKSPIDGNNSLYTEPPQFETSTKWLDFLKEWAIEKGIEIKDTDNPKELIKGLILKL